MFNKKKSNKGFTLVELLVVIAIIGILAVVALPALFKNIDKSKVADLESDISAIKSATISYTADKNVLPADTTGATAKASTDAIIAKLNGELDSLSNPFDAVYALSAVKTAGADAKETGEVILTIEFGSPLSDAAVSKLNDDLNSMKAKGKASIVDDATKKVLTVKIVDAGGLSQE